MKRIIVIVLLGLLITSCGDSKVFTKESNDESEEQQLSEATDPVEENDEHLYSITTVSVTKDAFLLGSDYPPTIIIPDIEGMRSTAFVLSFANPSGIVPIDLDANPLKTSSVFSIIETPESTGFPSTFIIHSATQGFILTSSHIIYFNPQNGSIYTTVNITNSVDITKSYTNSDDSSADSIQNPNTPGGIVVIGDKVFVSFANFINYFYPASCAPGVVKIFNISTSAPFISESGHFVTTDYNPTALTKLDDSTLLITNTGVMNILEGASQPATNSSVDVYSLSQNEIIANISVGPAALSFHPVALIEDQNRGFLASASRGEIYEIDLKNFEATRDITNPIKVTGNSVGADYLSFISTSYNDQYLFASSFDKSAVVPIDIYDNVVNVFASISIGYPKGVTADNPSGTNTGAGASAVRPGVPGEDFTGPDLYVLTGFPGTIVSINTWEQASVYKSTEKPDNITTLGSPSFGSNVNNDYEDESDVTYNDDIPIVIYIEEENPEPDPDPEETEESFEPCNGFAVAVKSFNPGEGYGFGYDNFPDIVLGGPEGKGSGGGGFDVLSLGKDGEITLDVGDCLIVDGDGPDFTIFENVFLIGGNPENPFKELATVGVSLDGINFTYFDCLDGSYPYTDCAGWNPTKSNVETNGIDPFDPDVSGGDPFDLADIGIEKARYIRIIDLSNGGGPNNSGFDLDAIAVINGGEFE
ncbi:hypothetical protein KKA47_00060 [bacterium]|nr:hypothetical protein [bacterium]